MPSTTGADIDLLGANTGAVGRLNSVYQGAQMILGVLRGIKNFLAAITDDWRQIQQSAFETARAVGLNRDQAMAYDRVLMESAKNIGRAYGVTYKDIAKWQEDYVTRTGKAIIMNRQQQESMAAMSRLAGSDVAAQMTDEMNKFGGSIDNAEFSLALVQERAKALGLSTKTASEALAKNMHLASTYQFKNGIDGLQKMLLTSQRLRVNMESITQAADGFRSIEGAIEKSARLQVLGGTFAQQFSNPMGVLYESMNDMEGFTKRLENTVKGLGTFNKKTGNVDINGLDQLRIQAAAEAMGMSRQELTQMVMSKAKEGEVTGALGKNANVGRFNDQQKALIQNKATWDADLKTFVINEFDKHGNVTGSTRVDQLTEDQVKLMQDSNLTEEKLWGDVHTIREVITGEFRQRARGTTSTNENIEGLKSEWSAMLAQFENIFMGTFGSWALNGSAFQPWDTMKWGSYPTGTLGEFANGGVVESPKKTEPVKAQFGAMIPGTSYTGDKVHVMANSGEMILNKDQQSGLWNTLKNLGKTAAMMYAGHKVGGMMGVRGMGTMIGLQSFMSGGNASIGQMAGSAAAMGVAQLVGRRMFGRSPMMMSPMMGSPLLGMRSPMMGGMGMTFVHPNVMMTGNVMMNGNIMGGTIADEMLGFGNSVDAATKSTANYGKALKDFSSKWTGRFMKNTTIGRGLNKTAAFGRLTRMKAASGLRSFGNTASAAIGRKYDSFIQNTKLGQWYENYRYQNALKPKTPNAWSRFKNSEFVSDAKRVFRGGRSTSDVIKASEAASSNAVKSTSKITKALSKVGGTKTISALGKGAKILGRAAGPLGVALGAMTLVSDVSSASSKYREQERAIEMSNMSDEEKARAKDDAVREKNKGIGGAVGGVSGGLAGAAAGAAIGSVIPVVGTAIGGIIGGIAGGFGGDILGKGIGSLFGGKNEKKLQAKKEAEAKNSLAIKGKSNEEIENIRRTIDNIYSYMLSGKLSETHAVKGKTISLPFKKPTELSINPLGVGGGLAGAAAGAAIGSVVPVIGTAIGGLAGGIIGSIAGGLSKKNEANVLPNAPEEIKVEASKPIGEKTYVSPVAQAEVKSVAASLPTVKDINLNVSGTIKLDGGNGTASSFNLDELIKDPTFVRKIKDMIVKSISETENGGKQNLEGDRSNRRR